MDQIKKFFKRLFYFILLLIFISSLGFLTYYLPATHKGFLVGTEIKRELSHGRKGDEFKDVRYIVARDYTSAKTLMFRNEDAPWPPYFKFDSGDLSGKVMNSKEYQPDAVVLITYYGFRFPLMSMYPNATNFKVVSPEYEHIPLFNIIFCTVYFLLFFLFILWLRKGSKKQDLIESTDHLESQ